MFESRARTMLCLTGRRIRWTRDMGRDKTSRTSGMCGWRQRAQPNAAMVCSVDVTPVECPVVLKHRLALFSRSGGHQRPFLAPPGSCGVRVIR